MAGMNKHRSSVVLYFKIYYKCPEHLSFPRVTTVSLEMTCYNGQVSFKHLSLLSFLSRGRSRNTAERRGSPGLRAAVQWVSSVWGRPSNAALPQPHSQNRQALCMPCWRLWPAWTLPTLWRAASAHPAPANSGTSLPSSGLKYKGVPFHIHPSLGALPQPCFLLQSLLHQG